MNRILLFFAAVAFLYSCKQSPKIYQWRGEDRKGIYNETNLKKEWKKDGPDIKWEYKSIGDGYGSPVITDKNLFVMGSVDSTGYLYAFDLLGNLLWKSDYGLEWTKNFVGSRCTPTIVDNLAYTCSGRGIVSCFDTKNGEKKWSFDMVKKYEGVLPYFGQSESLLIDNDKVFLVAGGKKNNIIGLNRFTGDLVWSCKGKGERPGYNSPTLIKKGDKNIIVAMTAYHLMGIESETGKILWTHEQTNTPIEKRKPTSGDTHGNTAYFDDSNIYYVAGDGNRAVKLKLSEDGSSIKEEWKSKRFDSYMGGFVKIGDYLYGTGTRKKDIRSANAITGEVVDSIKLGMGTIIAADNMLYFYSDRGRMNLIKPVDGKLEKISTFKVKKGTKEHFSHPVINNGVLYVRHGQLLLAYDIKAADKKG